MIIAAKGRSSAIPQARKKAFTTSKGKYGSVRVRDDKTGKFVRKPGYSFKFNPATQRALARTKKSTLTIRIVTKGATGLTKIYYQPIVLKR